MSKRNLRDAATLVQAIRILDKYRGTEEARIVLNRVVKQLIEKGVN